MLRVPRQKQAARGGLPVKMYVIARSGAGRPTLLHVIKPDYKTFCGVDVTRWSRVYLGPDQAKLIIERLLCRKCHRVDNSPFR